MTVKELINILEHVENKDKIVLVDKIGKPKFITELFVESSSIKDKENIVEAIMISAIDVKLKVNKYENTN